MKQCEIVAVVKDRKERAKAASTEAYHTLQKPDLMNGLIRSYRPRVEDDDKLPQERKNVQVSVGSMLAKVRAPLVELFDTVLTQDVGNCDAKANVTAAAAGRTLALPSVPATHLLFLEKQLADLLTLAKAIPVLDSSERWSLDQSSGLWASEAQRTVRTKKVPKPIVLYPATPEHPAQTQLLAEDIPVGEWEAVKFSGAVTTERKDAIVARIIALQEAVVQAREQANATQVERQEEGRLIWDFIFGE